MWDEPHRAAQALHAPHLHARGAVVLQQPHQRAHTAKAPEGHAAAGVASHAAQCSRRVLHDGSRLQRGKQVDQSLQQEAGRGFNNMRHHKYCMQLNVDVHAVKAMWWRQPLPSPDLHAVVGMDGVLPSWALRKGGQRSRGQLHRCVRTLQGQHGWCCQDMHLAWANGPPLHRVRLHQSLVAAHACDARQHMLQC